MCHALNVSIALEHVARVDDIKMVLRDAVRAREQSTGPRLIETIASSDCGSRYVCFLLRDEDEWSMLYNDGGTRWRHIVLSNPFPPDARVRDAACEHIRLAMATKDAVPEAERGSESCICKRDVGATPLHW